MIRMKEVTGKGGVPMPFHRCVSVPDAGIRLLCAPRIDLWRCLLPISIVKEGSRARGVVGPPRGLGGCTRRGQETGRHDLSADLSSDNTGDCHRKEVLVQVGFC